MKNKKSKVIKNQQKFFDLNAEKEAALTMVYDPFFDPYINKQQYQSLDWLSQQTRLLDYGCGTGLTLDLLRKQYPKQKYQITGVDISETAITQIKKKYPKFNFYKITDNKMPQIKNRSIDGVYMMHVLHHSKNHQQIFDEISKKMVKDGRYCINDLTSNNPFIRLGRRLFLYQPKFVKNRFNDDLVVDEDIPDKYNLDIPRIIRQLKKAGFKIETVESGHLFFFMFIWLDKFIPIKRFSPVRYIYQRLIDFEEWLLKFDFFKKYAEVIVIKCIK